MEIFWINCNFHFYKIMSTKNLSKTFQIFMFSDKLHGSSLFLLTLTYMKLLAIKIQVSSVHKIKFILLKRYCRQATILFWVLLIIREFPCDGFTLLWLTKLGISLPIKEICFNKRYFSKLQREEFQLGHIWKRDFFARRQYIDVKMCHFQMSLNCRELYGGGTNNKFKYGKNT